MRLTKKAAALLVAATMVVSMGVTPALATNTNTTTASTIGTAAGDSTTDTTVKYEVMSTYTWSVPATIDFGDNAGVQKTRVVNANGAENAQAVEAKTETDGSSTAGTAPAVYVTNSVIPVNKNLKITISTSNTYTDSKGFEIDNAGVKLYYTIKKPGEGSTTTELNNSNSTEVMSVASGTKESHQELTFTLTTANTAAEQAGLYQGTLSFTAAIK